MAIERRGRRNRGRSMIGHLDQSATERGGKVGRVEGRSETDSAAAGKHGLEAGLRVLPGGLWWGGGRSGRAMVDNGLAGWGSGE